MRWLILLPLFGCATVQKAQPYLQSCGDSFVAGAAQQIAPTVLTCLASDNYTPCLDALIPELGNAAICAVQAILKAYNTGAAAYSLTATNSAVTAHAADYLKTHSLQLAQ
jgi:hypothetical protein